MDPTPTPAPTPIPCPPPGAQGCFECPPGSGQVICVDGPWPAPAATVPTLDWTGLALMALLFALAGARRLRGA